MKKRLISLALASALLGGVATAGATTQSSSSDKKQSTTTKTASANLFTSSLDFLKFTFGNLDGDNNFRTGSFYLYDGTSKIASISYLIEGSSSYKYSFQGLVKGATYSNLVVDYLLDFKSPVSLAASSWSSWSSKYIISSASVKYAVASVPEPETYALLLAGLGVMGVVARRRKSA